MNTSVYKKLFLLYVVFLIYASIVPFDFISSAAQLGYAVRHINWTPFFLARDISLPDIASNIALFFPFGFLLASWLVRIFPGCIVIALSVVAGIWVSLFVETLQLFAVDRFTSISDVLNNGLGAFAGGCAAFIYDRYLRRYVEPAVREILNLPLLEVYTVCICTGILFFAIAPFDVSIDISDLKNSVKHALRFPHILVPWKYMQSSVNNFILFFIAAVTAHTAFFRTGHRIAGILITVAGAFAFAGSVEMMQLFIVSRSSSVSNLVFALAGAGFGAMTSVLYIKNRHPISRINGLLLWIYGAYLLFNTLFPFVPEQSFREKFTLYTFIPFSMYFVRINVFSFADLSVQIITFIPLGISGILNRNRKNSRAFAVGFISGMILEGLQAFVATRYCDSTDAILAGAGAYLGNVLFRKIVAFRNESAHNKNMQNLILKDNHNRT